MSATLQTVAIDSCQYLTYLKSSFLMQHFQYEYIHQVVFKLE